MMAQSSTASGVFDWIVDAVESSWSFAAAWLTSTVDSQVLVVLASPAIRSESESEAGLSIMGATSTNITVLSAILKIRKMHARRGTWELAPRVLELMLTALRAEADRARN